MNKAFLVLALVGLLVFAGCATAPEAGQKIAAGKATTEPVVEEAAQGLVSEQDTVEIGEMI
jgi:hypothetical protein